MNAKQKNTLIGAVAVLACLCVICLGIGWTLYDPEPQTAADFVEEYGGSQSVYEEILASNDCDWLQSQFDNAYAISQEAAPGTIHHKRATGFMTAANKRMEETGCYK